MKTQFWGVSVSRNGDNLLNIETNCLSGRELDEEDYRVIRMAALHLLSFIGESAAVIAAESAMERKL